MSVYLFNNKTMRAIAFSRVSTPKQGEGERQIHQIKKYCTLMGYELIENKTISEIISGVSEFRSGLDKLSMLNKNDADLIIVSESSRLTRRNDNDFTDLLQIVQTIQSTGLDLLILGSNQIYKADVKLTLIDVITLVIESDRNSKERLQNKERFRTGKEKKLNLGGYIGHTIPFGYLNNGQKTDYFSINEEQAKIIRLMFDLIGNQGYTVNKTALYLNQVMNFKCFETSILKRLNSRTYIGEYTIMGKVINVPSIVSEELFNQVQINIANNHLYSNKGVKHFNGLKGLAKCSCGCSLFIWANGGEKRAYKYHTYKCMSKSSSYNYKESCKNYGINSDFLISIVWNITKNYINIDDFKAKTDEQKQLIAIEIKSINQRNLTLLAKKSELNKNIDNLVTNIMTADKNIQPILNKKLSELVTALTATDKAIEKLNIELSKTSNKLKNLSTSLLPSLIGNINDEEKHEIFTKYIETVVYRSVDLYKGFVTIKYKNSIEITILIKNRPSRTAYALPLTFIFNEDSKTVRKTVIYKEDETENEMNLMQYNEIIDNPKRDLEEILDLVTGKSQNKYSFADMFENFPMNDYLMEL